MNSLSIGEKTKEKKEKLNYHEAWTTTVQHFGH